MSLTFYNSLSRQKEPFIPLDPDHVRMYVCGPTVYDRAHLGNARPVVVFDVLYRLLQAQFPKVTYVRNITDVDDKINAASLKLGISIGELTNRTIQDYHDDMAALGTLPPTIEPRATDHIPQMIDMIQRLIERGHAYEADGHVLFSVNTYPVYGRLSGRNQDELLAGARVEVAPYKKEPGDFVLWKPSTPDLPGWDSPWSRGRPGWHIECSAMSQAYLGQTFDIHGGGIDLIFPHHENEIAQSCCAHGTELMARYWLHNGHLTVHGDKMSKSLGNFFTVHDLLQEHAGESIRLALLMTHYRQPFDWSDDTLVRAKQALDRWYAALNTTEQEEGPIDSDVYQALADDLNTPLAISHLHQLVHQIYKTNDSAQKKRLGSLLKRSAGLLGLLQQPPLQWLQQDQSGGLGSSEIESLIENRRIARQNKDFAESDRIRIFLLENGIQLEDTSSGTTWRRA
ncbi:MAG: cysteine--tRNA ligase [Alphaproteobacteria bacterium]|nr:cysteine--tRNA ligase [Alphaproteobacteria bacterium]